MEAWKMVDSNYAGDVANGRIRIGTFESYKNLENGRADVLDAAVQVTGTNLTADSAQHRAALLKAKVFIAGGATIGKFEHNIKTPPAFVFCMTVPGCTYDPDPAKRPKTMFSVTDVEKLARVVAALHADRLGSFTIRSVSYERRRFDLFEPWGENDAFIKEPHFAAEQEIRIVWTPRPDVAVEPFLTEFHPDIGACFGVVC